MKLNNETVDESVDCEMQLNKDGFQDWGFRWSGDCSIGEHQQAPTKKGKSLWL